MIGLHDLLVRAAASAVADQDAATGSLPAGHNGCWQQRETPVRNTSHWLIGFLAAHRISGEPRFRSAAERALSYLCSSKARPGGASFWHREARPRDGCNGLIGQAWTLEALAEAADALGCDEAARLAERVFLSHGFDASAGLWSRLEVNGSDLGLDFTFNHQLWFAAAGALLAPHVDAEVGARVARFVDRLDANLDLYGSGLVRHPLHPRGFWWREPRYTWRFARARRAEDRELARKAAGYHAFNLYGFALLASRLPDHAFWRGPRFTRAWNLAATPAFRESLAINEYAYPYNPTGIEMAFAHEVFGRGARAEQERWLAEQLRRHYDFGAQRLARATPDPTTLAARLYEATRLPDLALRLEAS